MVESRSIKVNRIIDERTRPDSNFKDKQLYKCDVCWTCKYFDIQASTCVFTYEDALEIVNPELLYDREFYKPTLIKDPLYYRCMIWEELKLKPNL